MGTAPKVYLTNGGDVYVESGVDEDPDWDFARNLQVVLKNGPMEYSTSVFDATVGTSRGILHGANRDFSWQGLLVGPTDNRIYRTLDAVYYAPLDGASLRPSSVKSWRTSVEYLYSDDRDRTYKVDVSLRVDGRIGRLAVRASRPTLFMPLFDLRDAEVESRPRYSVEAQEGSAFVSSDAAPFAVHLTWKGQSSRDDLWTDWVYKLGDGFRYVDGGAVRFVKRSAHLYSPIAIESQDGSLDVEVPLQSQRRNVERCGSRLNERMKLIASSLSAPPGILEAIALRINRLASFGVPVDSIYRPEAGSMWFRRPWIRDLVEGLRWNSLTYVDALRCGKWFSDLILGLLESAVEEGGLRAVAGSGDYASDAFPQLLNVASSAYALTGSADVLSAASRVADAAASALRTGFSGCRLHDGLVICPADSSWIDVRYYLDGTPWPARLPIGWSGSADPSGLYALVEVNALYLESYSRLIGSLRSANLPVPDRVEGLVGELSDGYRRRFYSPGSLPPLTYDPSTGRLDATRGSPAVEALAILRGIIYSDGDLSGAWPQVEGITWSRRMKVLGEGSAPFGIVARDVERRPYLGDAEYHGYVVWPRDTPYLLEVMGALSRDVEGVLVNNLDHMLAEGAVGYSSELFSAPIGGNPSPGEASGNPVPVKNPAQYWSHWCDPYLEHYGWRRR